MANVLAKKALNALSEFLNPVNVALHHAPGAIRGVGRAGLELLYSLFDAVVYRDISDQVADYRERFHRLQCDRFPLRHVAHARHAHKLRHPVDFRRTGSAFPRLAIPSHGKVGRVMCLNLMDGVQHNHPFRDFSFVFPEILVVGAPYPEDNVCHSCPYAYRGNARDTFTSSVL
jgi:hypothetical protein